MCGKFNDVSTVFPPQSVWDTKLTTGDGSLSEGDDNVNKPVSMGSNY